MTRSPPAQVPCASEPEGDLLILVDERNRRKGCLDKMQVHRLGLLHRAFSVFLLTPDGRFLVQKRSASKYHAGRLWANSCCGHPRPGERVLSGARRRVTEELGVSCRPRLQFTTRYGCRLAGGMSENEFVFVYAALLREPPSPNPLEIEAVAYLDVESLETQVRDVPVQLAPWLVHYVENHRGAVRQMAEAARTGQLE